MHINMCTAQYLYLIFVKGALLLSVGRRSGRQKSSCLSQNLVDGGCSRRAGARGLDKLFLLQRLQNRMERSERYACRFGQYSYFRLNPFS